MNKERFIPKDKYIDLPFDLYRLIIPNYYWLTSDFSTCYRFMHYPGEMTEKKDITLMIMTSSCKKPSYSFDCSIEYNINEETVFINFLNDRFKVQYIKVYYGNTTSYILTLMSSKGISGEFYAAISEPFSNEYREIYSSR